MFSTGEQRILAWLASVIALFFIPLPEANAVPSFARQTGQACVACHVSFPELTPFGRYFKLTGYTIGTRQLFPLAVMAQASYTSIGKATDETGSTVVLKNNNFVFSGASLFIAGKATDNIGGFIQATYNNLVPTTDANGNPSLEGHSSSDNTDLRVVGKSGPLDAREVQWIYGLTVNNNPTVQDVWNSTPAFGFPFATPPLAITPTAKTQIDGALDQQVAAIGGYVYWRKMLYGEVSMYRTADGPFTFLRWGQDTTTPGAVARLKGYNPYWRLALNHEWGPSSLMVGTYGLQIDRYPDDTMPTTPTDRFRDYAFDTQYQYITDPHTITAQATYIREKQDWRASFPTGGIGAGPTPANPSDTLNTLKAKVTYYYQRKYGVTVAYFATTGNSDAGLYSPASVTGSVTNSPDTHGYIFQLDYLPIPNLRLMLQYTAFGKFNGSRDNYDGFGRNARDNNTLFFNVWLAF